MFNFDSICKAAGYTPTEEQINKEIDKKYNEIKEKANLFNQLYFVTKMGGKL